MKKWKIFIVLIIILPLFLTLPAQNSEDFVPIFNGQDLSGWVNVNCAPETWRVRDSMIICSGLPMGVLRTSRRTTSPVTVRFSFSWATVKANFLPGRN